MATKCDPAKATCTTFSEEEFGKRMDRCLTDVLMKATGGLVMGSVLSLLFFRQKKWPIILAGGIGTGVALRACEHQLNAAEPEDKPESYY